MRIKRAIKELFGLPQWEVESRIIPKPYHITTSEDQLYEAVIQHGDHIFDIGANIGQVTKLCAYLSGPTGKVISFEPVWPMYEKLCDNTRKLTKEACSVVPIPFGLGRSEEVLEFTVPAGKFSMASSASSVNWRDITEAESTATYHCKVLRLDGFLGWSSEKAPDFIKIDVEGAELFVLQGASGLFDAGIRPILFIEVFAPWERAFNYSPWDVLSLLQQYGYKLFFACPSGLVSHTSTRKMPFPIGFENGYNVLALEPNTHSARIERLSPLMSGHIKDILPLHPAPRLNKI